MGRPVGVESYTNADIQALLKCVKELLPKQPQDWDKVGALYREVHARPSDRAERYATSLKKKFRGILLNKTAGALDAEVKEARTIQVLIDSKDESSEAVAGHGFRILRRQNSESAVTNSHAVSDESPHSRRDDEAIEVESESPVHTPDPEHSIIQSVNRPETHVLIASAPSMITTLASELSVTSSTRSASDRAAFRGVRRRRKSQVDAPLDDLKDQGRVFSKDMTSTEGFLRWQLASEIAERRRLQRQVEDLHDRIDDLRDDHRAEMESLRGSLLDKVEILRERNLSLAVKNSHLHAEVLALRAAQRNETQGGEAVESASS